MVFNAFIIFNRCILIDLYDYIKDLDNIKDLIPEYAKDNFIRNKIKNFFSSKQYSSDIDYTQYRLDILNNVLPMKLLKDIRLLENMYNHKIQYVLANIVLIILLLCKYNLHRCIPILVIWIIKQYPL